MSLNVITKTTVRALIAGGGLLATWLAVGTNHNSPSSLAQTSAPRTTTTRETTAEDLKTQAAKLREHLSSGQLRPSTRNPFRFGPPKHAVPKSEPADAPAS